MSTTLEKLRKAVNKLNIQELELEKFFQLSNDLLCIATIDGKIIKANKKFTDLTGYSSTELISLDKLGLVCDEDKFNAAEFCKLDEETKMVICIKDKNDNCLKVEWSKSKPDERGYIYVIGRLI